VRRGLAPSRQLAQADIAAGRVLVSGSTASKAARLVAPEEPIVLVGPAGRFVGRGGDKLEAALVRFAVRIEGRRCLDAGASTGGFTDCLLQRGAREVVAIDVGYGQIHERLRSDRRVEVRERTNIRHLTLAALGDPADVVVADLSFISLRTVAGALLDLAAPSADLVLLVKPQFEAGRQVAAKGKGVIVDPEVWRGALAGVRAALEERGAVIMDVMASPLTGADGNVELLLHAIAPPGHGAPASLDAAIDEAIAAGVSLREHS
jgi:23S rRNA (cytidine1920-2'-O)/16S rRNA (cytidine1409-2'-O)-methyltransferase